MVNQLDEFLEKFNFSINDFDLIDRCIYVPKKTYYCIYSPYELESMYKLDSLVNVSDRLSIYMSNLLNADLKDLMYMEFEKTYIIADNFDTVKRIMESRMLE